jgi:6,7-dimethyl-8-ribityllumazine synthase
MSDRMNEIESRLREMSAPPQEEAVREEETSGAPAGPAAAAEQPETAPRPLEPEDPGPTPEAVPELKEEPESEPAVEHAEGELNLPDGYHVLSGGVDGRRAVGVVVSRFNGEITDRLLKRALDELEEVGVPREAIMVMPVPGAFELPLAAMALAKTRRYACIVALGCVIRGETPHFDLIAHETASGLQLAAIETGVPVAFGVLTVENREQAEERVENAAQAVRSALEMADVFSQLRASAAGPLH